jgi:hypothetical protein
MESKTNWTGIFWNLVPTLGAIVASWVSLQGTLIKMDAKIELNAVKEDNRMTNNERRDLEQDKSINELYQRIQDHEFWLKDKEDAKRNR